MNACELLLGVMVACGVVLLVVEMSLESRNVAPSSNRSWELIVLQVRQSVIYAFDYAIAYLSSVGFILILLGLALPYACSGKRERSDYD